MEVLQSSKQVVDGNDVAVDSVTFIGDGNQEATA